MRRGRVLGALVAISAIAVVVITSAGAKRQPPDDEEKNDLSAEIWSVLQKPDR